MLREIGVKSIRGLVLVHILVFRMPITTLLFHQLFRLHAEGKLFKAARVDELPVSGKKIYFQIMMPMALRRSSRGHQSCR
jgi:ABC-type glycerol-3-phosphate transport system permease component